MNREDLYLVSLTVAGIDLGVWDTFDGGTVETQSTKYRSGGQADAVSLGGPRDTSDVNVGKKYESDVNAVYHWLTAQVGKPDIAVVTRQPLDREFKAFGRPEVYKGTVKSVAPPKSDSNSNAAAIIAAVVEVTGLPA